MGRRRRRGSGRRWLGEVDDDELARQYRGALCVVYPSLYEGFGLPVLEAMACGAAVVTSAGGATGEVAGDAAVLVDPLDVGAIAAGIEEAVARRDQLRLARPRARARFSWDEVARLGRRVSQGGGVSAPLVVIDADVLGRRRTGDETYVEHLLRALPAVGDGLRFAAVTRRPDLVPPGIEPIELSARVQEVRMAFRVPLAAPPSGSRRSCPLSMPFRSLALPGGPHRPRPLVRTRRIVDGKERLAIFRIVVPWSARRARRVLAISQRTE